MGLSSLISIQFFSFSFIAYKKVRNLVWPAGFLISFRMTSTWSCWGGVERVIAVLNRATTNSQHPIMKHLSLYRAILHQAILPLHREGQGLQCTVDRGFKSPMLYPKLRPHSHLGIAEPWEELLISAYVSANVLKCTMCFWCHYILMEPQMWVAGALFEARRKSKSCTPT